MSNTTVHITLTLTFKDHWPHDLHDLAEGSSTFITFLMFRLRRGIEGESKPGRQAMLGMMAMAGKGERKLLNFLEVWCVKYFK